jgi:O-antigen/teichoic acid export membrane protein
MGRGTIYLITANGVLALVGYIIHFWLGRHLGPADYGTFGVVLYLMTTVNLFLTSGFPQSASKYIAEDYSRAGSIMRAANRIQLVFCALLFGLYFGLAGVIAGLFNDTSLTPYIRISALAIPIYALFSLYGGGYLNGLHKFGRQALASVGDSVAKVGAVFALVLFGFGVGGAITGYIIATLVGFLLAWRFVRPVEKSKVNFGWRKLVGFGIPATLFAATFFLLMSIDLFVVKAIGAGEAETGYYTSATTISKVPYFLFAGLAMTLLPSISKSTSSNNTELTQGYIRQSMRYMLMLLIPVVLLISATAADLLTMVYSSLYIEAASSLSILVFGLGFLSVFFVLSNVIMGSGKPKVTLGMALPLAGVDIGLNIFLIPRYGLVGAAWATTITGFLGMCAASVYMLWRFKTLVNPKSLGKICLASLVIYVIALQVSLSPLWLPLIYLGLLALYGGLLWLIRELKSEDLATFKRILPLERLTGGGGGLAP